LQACGPVRDQEPYLPGAERVIAIGKIDPFVITHRMLLNEAAAGYTTFKNDKNECIKIVMKPELN
jgi:threonine dehydrogenase-like Zn-dependent dehydrogenase